MTRYYLTVRAFPAPKLLFQSHRHSAPRGSETTVQGGVIMHFILQRTRRITRESSIARRPEVVLMMWYIRHS